MKSATLSTLSITLIIVIIITFISFSSASTCRAFNCLEDNTQNCGTINNIVYSCSSSYYCNSSSSSCVRLLVEGEQCKITPTSSDSFCSSELFCDNTLTPDDATGLCTPKTYDRLEGESCSNTIPWGRNCDGRHQCGYYSSICEKLPVEGEACAGFCSGAAYCDYNEWICKASFSYEIGTSCYRTEQCVPGAICYGPTEETKICIAGVNSSSIPCNSKADCPSSLESCSCNFLPYHRSTQCQAPPKYTQTMANAHRALFTCLYDESCGSSTCEACAQEYCNYFTTNLMVPYNMYGYPELWCRGEKSVIDFVSSHCFN